MIYFIYQHLMRILTRFSMKAMIIVIMIMTMIAVLVLKTLTIIKRNLLKIKIQIF